MSNDADKRFGRFVDAVEYGECRACGIAIHDENRICGYCSDHTPESSATTKAEATMREFIRLSVLGRGDIPMDVRKGAIEVFHSIGYENGAMFRCRVCGTLWRAHSHGWSLKNPGQKLSLCCDNHPGFLCAIEPLPNDSDEARKPAQIMPPDKDQELAGPAKISKDAAMIISNQSKRIAEFDLCIHRVAEALGACCGGVDVDQTQEGSTTRVLLEKIAELKQRQTVAENSKLHADLIRKDERMRCAVVGRRAQLEGKLVDVEIISRSLPDGVSI